MYHNMSTFKTNRITLFILLLASFLGFIFVLLLNERISMCISSLLILFVIWFLWRKYTFSFKYITITSAFFILFVCILYIPGILVIFFRHHDSSVRFFAGINLSLIFTTIGVIFVDLVFKNRLIKRINIFFKRKVAVLYTGCVYPILTIYVLIAILLVLYYFRIAPSIPLIYLIRHPGAARVSQEMRETAFKLLNTPYRMPLFWLRKFGFAILDSFLFLSYLLTRKKNFLVIFLLMLFMGVLYCGATTSRSEVVILVLTLLLSYWIYGSEKKIKIKKILVYLFLILLFPILIYTFQSGFNRSFVNIMYGIGRRIFYTPVNILYSTFELFPTHHEYLYGSSIQFFHRLGFTQFFDLSNYLFRFVNPESPLLSTGTSPAPFIGDFYANFGFIGIVIGSFIVGLWLRVSDAFFAFSDKSLFAISVYAYLIYAFSWANFTAFTTILSSYGVMIIYIIYILTDRIYKICVNSKKSCLSDREERYESGCLKT